MANDYKTDQGKPPVLDALLPFYPALERLALMMRDAAEVHKLQGAKDPFNEWRQLPQAKKRLANAAMRHMLKGPWKHDEVLTKHPHMALVLFNVLASLTLHEEDNAATCCGAADAPSLSCDTEEGLELEGLRRAALALYRAGRWELPPPISGPVQDASTQAEHGRMWADLRDALGLPPGTSSPIHGPAGADWRCRHPWSQRNLTTNVCTACDQVVTR